MFDISILYILLVFFGWRIEITQVCTAKVCEKKNMSFKRTLELIVGCPEKFRWRKISGEFPTPPPLKMMVPGFFFKSSLLVMKPCKKSGKLVFFLKTFSWHNSCLSARRKLGFLEDIWWRTSWTESLGLVVVSQFGNCWEGLKNGIRVVILYTVYIWTCRYCVYIIHIYIYIYVCVCVHSSWFFVLFKCSEFSELLWDPFQRLLKRNTPRFVGSVWLSLFPAQVE